MQPEKQESAWLYEGLAWLDLNRSRIIAGAVVALALVVGGYIYFWMRGQTELEANRSLLSLKTSLASEGAAASAADFLRVAEAYPSSRAADRALMLAAGQLFRDGRYAEAQPHFEKLLAQDRRGLLAPLAALGVAACLDAQDQVDAAMTRYRTVVADYPDSPVAARAKFAMALLHESRGEPEAAFKLYHELHATPTAGRASMEASVKREALLKQHPQLAAALPSVAPSLAPATPAAPAGSATNKIAGQP